MASPLPQQLIDSHGRRMRKLRLSLLDACNFRCLYCMPVTQKFMPAKDWLTVDEIANITSVLVGFGLEQVRVTGGEPTMRPEFREIIARLSELPIRKLALTTNGFSLHRHLEFLRGTRCQHLNVSLDSLNEEKFAKITHAQHFRDVVRSIEDAAAQGFNVKVNAVIMRGINDDEILDFVQFSARTGVEVRFLELMKIGHARALGDRALVPAAEIIARLRESRQLTPVVMEKDSTSFNFATDCGAQIGFIASETQAFCDTCSRLRVSASGVLRACLMAEEGISLKGLSPDGILDALHLSMAQKPNFRKKETPVDMNRLGG